MTNTIFDCRFQISFKLFIVAIALSIIFRLGPLAIADSHIVGDFNDTGKADTTVIAKVTVYDKTAWDDYEEKAKTTKVKPPRAIGSGSDTLAHDRHIDCRAYPKDVNQRMVLVFSTSKPEEWITDRDELEVTAEQEIKFDTVSFVHRSSELDAKIAPVESAAKTDLKDQIATQKFSDLLKGAKPLLRTTNEKLRWALAQDRFLELTDSASWERYQSFKAAFPDKDLRKLTQAKQQIVVQQRYDLLTTGVSANPREAWSTTKLAENLKQPTASLPEGANPLKEFSSLMKTTSKVYSNYETPNGVNDNRLVHQVKTLRETLDRE